MRKPTHAITYGEEVVPFSLSLSDRRTLEVSVHPDASVHVRGPEDGDLDAIRAAVQDRARWIVQRRQEISARGPLSQRQYVSGATHRYLGRQYRLRIADVSRRADESVRLRGGHFHVTASSLERVEPLLDCWYRAHARETFRRRLGRCLNLVRPHGVEPPPWAMRVMRTRWGSCTASGRLLLNPDLVRAPIACVDYVIVHELCHLVHPHHGPAFYRLLSTVRPSWRQDKDRLNRRAW